MNTYSGWLPFQLNIVYNLVVTQTCHIQEIYVVYVFILDYSSFKKRVQDSKGVSDEYKENGEY